MSHLYQEIAESIRRRIASGELAPGDRLPAVRVMAQQWRCTPGTVSRAYQELAEQGLVSGRRGSGTRVVDNPLVDGRLELSWANLINRAEQFLLEALSGGHTPDQAHSALMVAVSRWEALKDHRPPKRKPAPPTGRLRFVGSHDLTVEMLVGKLAQTQDKYKLELDFVGSLGGLIALSRGEADVAGAHLWDAVEDAYNLPFVRRILPFQRLALVTLVERKQGFIVPQGNPQGIKELADLIRPEVRLINRQPGSGTRIWLDEQLKAAAISSDQIKGYGDEGATHMDVAQAVQSGQATTALGIQAAALAYGLDFIPLMEELYQLVVPQAVWERPVWQALLATIRSNAFKTAVNDLGGYNTAETGQVTWVN